MSTVTTLVPVYENTFDPRYPLCSKCGRRHHPHPLKYLADLEADNEQKADKKRGRIGAA